MSQTERWKQILTDSDQRVQESLIQIFPQLTVDVIQMSILNPVNRGPINDEASLLQSCIDDLLELRTFRRESVSSASTGLGDSSAGSGFDIGVSPVHHHPGVGSFGTKNFLSTSAISLSSDSSDSSSNLPDYRLGQTASYLPDRPIKSEDGYFIVPDDSPCKLMSPSSIGNRHSRPPKRPAADMYGTPPEWTAKRLHSASDVNDNTKTELLRTTNISSTISSSSKPQPTATQVELTSQPSPGDTAAQSVMPTVSKTETCTGNIEVQSAPGSSILPATSQVPTQPTPPRTPTMEEQIDQMLHEVVTLVSDVDLNYAKDMLRRFYGGMYVVNDVCNALMEQETYPKQAKPVPLETPEQLRVKENNTDYYKNYSNSISSMEYSTQCEKLLQNDFKKISVKDLRNIKRYFNGHYAPTRKCIMDGLIAAGIDIKEFCGRSSSVSSPPPVKNKDAQSAQTSTGPVVLSVQIKVPFIGDNGTFIMYTVKFLKCGRSRNLPLGPSWDRDLKEEVDFVIQRSNLEKEEQDHALAMSVNESEYETTGQLIECGCCYGDVPFESMVQCYEGHLFCQECLKHYAQEAVFGQGKAKMECMGEGCEATFPKSQLVNTLPKNVLEKYEDRLREEALNLADMENLVRCPHCEFAVLMDDPNDKVFKCQNPSCLKETCRFCQEDWSEHFGIPCKELEKKDETKLRLKFEEKMTMAKIRVCFRCKQSYTKLDGCNKITCRCGAKMCYICRKPNIDYNHFCNHARDPGKGCTVCSNCSLWTNPDEDDDRAVKEIQQEAVKERKAQGFEDDRLIGAPEEKAAKLAQTKQGHPQRH